ncbi:MAG: ParA family protein [Cytophagales bacterium]|nr:ParA family protein [Cytophagales bacterium]
MAKIISVLNHKGGVGKTTTSIHIGRSLADMGQKVLVVDFDPQANATIHLGIQEPGKNIADAILRSEPLPYSEISDNFYLCEGSLELASAEKEFAGSVSVYIRLKKALSGIKDKFDYIFIDCPPSLGFFTINALVAANRALIVTNPTKLAIQGIPTVLDLIEEVQETNPELQLMGVLIADSEKLIASSVIEEHLRQEDFRVFDTVIRHYKHYKEASIVGQTVHDFAPTHKALEDYNNLAMEVMNG